MFIGREAEMNFFNSKYNSNKSELIVLYGRRRIGKTETLKEFCKNKQHVFFSCTQSTDKILLQRFSKVMLKEQLPQRKYISEFADWEKAFESIADLPYEQKKLIIIDEFPYICKSNNSIPSILQNIWDGLLQYENVMIVLCGSSMSFIEKDLLAEKNPLYGRATGIYKMKEMTFHDVIQFFPEYSCKDQVITYSILGGIPHYLKQWNPALSVEDNIKHNILSKGSILYNEVEFLLHQELRETPIYNSILETVALGNTKLNDISQKSLVGNTSKTSIYLNNLIELGLIEKEYSVDAGPKEISNTHRGIFHLSDHFFRFWYRFCFTNYSQLEDGDVDGVYHHLIEPELHQFASLAFESICLEFIKSKQRKNELPFRYAKIGRWMGKTTVRDTNSQHGTRIAETEIDILAMSKDEKKIIVGECKFKTAPFSYSEYLNTVTKLSSLKNSTEFYYMLFSENGFDQKITENHSNAHLTLYSLDTIVKEI